MNYNPDKDELLIDMYYGDLLIAIDCGRQYTLVIEWSIQ